MTRTQLRRRLEALVTDERGFSLIEAVVAVTIMFGTLVSLAYVVTAGLGVQSVTRQRQVATGISNEVMEQIRGLAYDRVRAGHLSSDVDPSTDPNLKSCDAGTSVRFLSCAAVAESPGSGEKIVRSDGLTNVVPLVPHMSSTSPNTNRVINGVTYAWSTYVTRADPVTRADGVVEAQPYRVTVIVTWTGRIGTQSVRTQSILWAPEGCRSSETHPFPAPCQPFFFGEVTVPKGVIEIEGTIEGVPVSAELGLVGASASVQHEQLGKALSAFTTSRASVADSSTVSGGVLGSVAGDNDPGTAAGTYGQARCGLTIACTGGSVRTPSVGSSGLRVWTDPMADAYTTSSSATNGSHVCFPWGVVQSDGLPCAGSRLYQPQTGAELDLLGTFLADEAELVYVQNSGSSTRAWADRAVYPAPNTLTPPSFSRQCNPAAGSGCLWMYGRRRIEGVTLGWLPDAWGDGGLAGFDGFLRISGYDDVVTAAVGSGAPVPQVTGPSGTLTVYNQTASSYESLALTNAALNGLDRSVTVTRVVDARNVTVTIRTVPQGMSAGRVSVSPAIGGTLERASAQSVPPSVQLSYTVEANGLVLADLTITMNLGTLDSSGTYAPAPLEGS